MIFSVSLRPFGAFLLVCCSMICSYSQHDEKQRDVWSRPQLSAHVAIEDWRCYPVEIRGEAFSASLTTYNGTAPLRVQIAYAHPVARGWQAWGALEYSTVGLGVGLKVDDPVGGARYVTNQIGVHELYTGRLMAGLQVNIPLYKRSRIIIGAGGGIQWAAYTDFQQKISTIVIGASGPVSVHIGEISGNNHGLQLNQLLRISEIMLSRFLIGLCSSGAGDFRVLRAD